MSTWFLTYPRGLAFDFADPRPEAIDIEDIAWSLSQMLRFNGHTRFAYSVAAHSIGVSYLVPAEDAFEGLMHDAAEAYVGDVVRPLKKLLGRAFGDLEDRIEQIIAAKFGLRWPWPPSVKVADMRMLAAERLHLQVHQPDAPAYQWIRDELVEPAPEHLVDTLSPAGVVRARFLERFWEISALRRRSP